MYKDQNKKRAYFKDYMIIRTPEDFTKEALSLMAPKRADYSSGTIWENFDRVTEVVRWFTNPIDIPYIVLIMTKVCRLAVLLSNNRSPNNESIEDSFKDLINYCSLWGSKRCQKLD